MGDEADVVISQDTSYPRAHPSLPTTGLFISIRYVANFPRSLLLGTDNASLFVLRAPFSLANFLRWFLHYLLCSPPTSLSALQEVYPDPETFKPERFIEDGKLIGTKYSERGHHAYGFGRR